MVNFLVIVICFIVFFSVLVFFTISCEPVLLNSYFVEVHLLVDQILLDSAHVLKI